jgi:hypothetical protein
MKLEIRKLDVGYFRAFVDGVQTDYAIVITSHPSGTRNKSTYKVMRGSVEISPKPTYMFCIQMNIHKAKAFLIKAIEKEFA